MKTQIIEKLKKQIKNIKRAYPTEDGVMPFIFTTSEGEAILQALEEQPFCDSCEATREVKLFCVQKGEKKCGNVKSLLFGYIVDKTTSCVHHSRRKELTNEKCEHVTPICYNPDAFCYRSECDQPDSCIHHSGRKEKK